MNRIFQTDPEQATGKAKQLFDEVIDRTGLAPNAIRVFGNSPAALEGYLNLSGSLAGGVLSAQLREQIALAVAEISGCGYCLSAHVDSARREGLSEEQIDAARRGVAAESKANATLKLARSIALQRGQIGDNDLRAARSAGLNEAELVEIVMHVGLNTLTNLVNNVARTVIDFPEVKPGEFPSETQVRAGAR